MSLKEEVKLLIEVLKDYDFSVKRRFRTDYGPSGETEWEINSHIRNTPYDGWRGGLLILSNNKDKVFYSFGKGGSKDGYWKQLDSCKNHEMGFQMSKWTSELDLEEMVQFLTGPN